MRGMDSQLATSREGMMAHVPLAVPVPSALPRTLVPRPGGRPANDETNDQQDNLWLFDAAAASPPEENHGTENNATRNSITGPPHPGAPKISVFHAQQQTRKVPIVMKRFPMISFPQSPPKRTINGNINGNGNGQHSMTSPPGRNGGLDIGGGRRKRQKGTEGGTHFSPRNKVRVCAPIAPPKKPAGKNTTIILEAFDILKRKNKDLEQQVESQTKVVQSQEKRIAVLVRLLLEERESKTTDVARAMDDIPKYDRPPFS